MEDFHRQSLEKLCLICGDVYKKCFPVSEYKDKLEKAFYFKVSEKSDCSIFPQNFCEKCYFKKTNILKRQTTAKPTQIPIWRAHGKECIACEKASQTKKTGRKRKIQRPGRPGPADRIWSRKQSESLQEGIKNPLPKDFWESNAIDKVNICENLNPQLPLCFCKLCGQLMKKPIMVKSCEHCFCLNCLLANIEGKLPNDVLCPSCGVNFTAEGIGESKSINTMFKALRLVCSKGCEYTKSIDEYNEIITHQESCKGLKNLKISDILNLPAESPLPIEAEKAAAKIVKMKLANSESGNARISLPTGGPRVSFIALFFESNYKVFQS